MLKIVGDMSPTSRMEEVSKFFSSTITALQNFVCLIRPNMWSNNVSKENEDEEMLDYSNVSKVLDENGVPTGKIMFQVDDADMPKLQRLQEFRRRVPTMTPEEKKHKKSTKPKKNKERKRTLPVVEPIKVVKKKTVSFGTVDFGDEKRKKGPNKKDVQAQLKGVLKKQDKIQNASADVASEMIKESDWDKAMRQASGEKVNDNPTLLKKAIKRKQNKKEKSKVDHKNRLKKVEKDKADRQHKRQENIQKRVDAKKASNKKKRK